LRIGRIGFAVSVAYLVGVYLVFFLVWTPTSAAVIWGVQGRYFLVILRALALSALSVAVLAHRTLPTVVRATAAITAATISGFATLVAVFPVIRLGG